MYIYIGVNNGSEKLWTKNTATSGKLIKAVNNFVYIFVCIYCTSQWGRLEYTSLFAGLVGWRAMSEKIVSKAVGENGDGLDV